MSEADSQRTSTIQNSLTEFYRSIMPQLLRAMPTGAQISSPLFLSVRPEYETAKCRLLLVGQETHSWYGLIDDLKGVADPVDVMQARYREFELGQHCRKSLFCNAMHEIQRKLEPFVPPLGFMWSDLFSCDEKMKTPSSEIGDRLRSLRILPNEIAILRPHVIIFLCGPAYDYTINCLFPGCSFEQFAPGVPDRQLAGVRHNGLPTLTFRTYHPSSLRRQRKTHYLDLIITAIREVLAAE
jgi:hypothetical protein